MNFLFPFAALLWAACFLFRGPVAAAEEPPRRSGPPENWLQELGNWQQQSGEWKVGGGSAEVTAGETVAELSGKRAIRLPGRWLSFKLALAGESAKAGLWIAGAQDSRGELLRFSIDSATGDLTNGRGKVIAPLGELQPSVDLLLRFEADKLILSRGGATLAELPVTYSEPQATLSLFAERGTANFKEVLLSAERTTAEIMAPPVAPEPPKRRARAADPALAGERVALDFPGAQPVTLKSGWNEYFGMHVAAGPWKSIRQFDGPVFGFPPSNRHTGDVKSFPGPFGKTPVEVSLADFRDWKRKDARGLDENLKTLIESNIAGLFIAPWGPPFTPVQQDHVWSLMKVLYGGNVGAEGRVFLQWGDDINFRKLGSAAYTRSTGFEPRGNSSPPRGSNAPADAVAYAENYFAPAVEAVMLASQEIYRDARHIPIVLGSCARASTAESREWYRRVIEHQIEGSRAPSLKGIKVLELVDYLTVNYPFAGEHDAGALQDLWDRYGAKVKGLWVTEEYGPTARGLEPFLERLALFLEWAGANQLNAQQARLFWNLPDERRDAQKLTDLARHLGEAFEGSALDVTKTVVDSGQIYRIRGGESRYLFAHVPTTERRGRKGVAITELAFEPPAALANRSWTARFIYAKQRRDDASGEMLPIDRQEGKLVIAVEANSRDGWALLLTASEADRP